MFVGKVSFGSVIAVYGQQKKIKKLNSRLSDPIRQGKIMVKDVTHRYENAGTNGLLARAAERGENVSIYITGSDVAKVKRQEKTWSTLDGILSNMSSYYDVNKQSVWTVAQNIIESK